MRRRGFTLIELLVIVAILGLLVSILVPSLKRAREISQEKGAETVATWIKVDRKIPGNSESFYYVIDADGRQWQCEEDGEGIPFVFRYIEEDKEYNVQGKKTQSGGWILISATER